MTEYFGEHTSRERIDQAFRDVEECDRVKEVVSLIKETNLPPTCPECGFVDEPDPDYGCYQCGYEHFVKKGATEAEIARFIKDTPEHIQKTRPGFIVICAQCGSLDVYVDDSLGFSAISGSWGSVDLVCENCDRRVEIRSSY